jgi:hypothetical protein
MGATCTGSVTANIGLYLDGAVVPNTMTAVPAASAPGFIELVATVNLTAAAHTFAVGLDCPGAETIVTPGSVPDVTWTTILPGS